MMSCSDALLDQCKENAVREPLRICGCPRATNRKTGSPGGYLGCRARTHADFPELTRQYQYVQAWARPPPSVPSASPRFHRGELRQTCRYCLPGRARLATKPAADRIDRISHHDGNCSGRLLNRAAPAAGVPKTITSTLSSTSSAASFGKAGVSPVGKSPFDDEIFPFGISLFAHTPRERAVKALFAPRFPRWTPERNPIRQTLPGVCARPATATRLPRRRAA